MSFPFMVNNNVTMETGCCKCKESKSDASSAFENALAEMMHEGNAQISVTQVHVKGSLMSDEDVALQENENLKDLCERLDYMMDLFFVRNNIPKDPPVKVEYSYTKTEVVITGDREDIEELNELINEDMDIVEQIKATLNVASHVINMAESLAFQSEYRNSTEPKTVVDKFAYLFDEDRHSHIPSLSYGDKLGILSDGKSYSL